MEFIFNDNFPLRLLMEHDKNVREKQSLEKIKTNEDSERRFHITRHEINRTFSWLQEQKHRFEF